MKSFRSLGSVLKQIMLLAVLLLSTVLLIRIDARGQELSSVKGGLGGTITDVSGAAVPGAKVTVTGAADTRVVTSDAMGAFSVTDITPGMYDVRVEKAGFTTSEAKNVEVVINRISNVRLTVNLGAVTQTVEVNAATTAIDTTSTAVSTNLNTAFYSQVPVPRNVGALFYVAPGVTGGLGTGNSNPSIGGATGLENSYVADGVGINDAGYGGMGVYSPSYGSLGTGINLSFIEEVQVKTEAFEPKYGGVNGGVVQLVTKSGGNTYHGVLEAFFAPGGMSAAYRSADSYRTFAPPTFQHGFIFSQPSFDGDFQFGGYIPVKGNHDKLFFFGAFNPALNQVSWRAPNTSVAQALYAHGPYQTTITSYNWAGKLTYKINEATSLEGSAYGDPSSSNYGFGAVYTSPFSYPNLNQKNTTGFSKWDFGGRSVVARLNSTLSPRTQLSLAATMKLSHFTEYGFSNLFSISDRTSGVTQYQGLGEFQNPNTHTYGVNADLQQSARFFGFHTFSIGYGLTRSIYDATRDYSGGRFTFPTQNAAGASVDSLGGGALAGQSTSASFYLSKAPKSCTLQYCPYYTDGAGHLDQVYLRQVRGVFSTPLVSSSQNYQAIYGNDSWEVNRFVTVSAGLRWEQEQLAGPNQFYVFNDNWSPRLGINVDPFGDRKTKVFFNWGRYTQALPTDAAIRELNQELDACGGGSCRWAVPQDANHNLLTNADGTISPVLDAAHLLNGVPGTGFEKSTIVATPSTLELIHSGTRLNFEEEYVAGVERQVKYGIVLSARYSDRRLLRIVEDMQGVSPEGAAGQSNDFLQNQIYVIGNPGPGADYFVNEHEMTYDPNGPTPAACTADYGVQQDSLGKTLGAACDTDPVPNSALNPYTGPGDPVNSPGWTRSDGEPDGFARPVRHYQALELEANKSFSHNFLIRANYRFAKLYGNYEGLFRNDNQQSDPGISSLFDFTTGQLGLLGAQFTPGYLNADRRNVGNLYASYYVANSFMRKLTAGLGVRGQSGLPVSRLASHPVYQNTGEIPIGGRGTFGTTPTSIEIDLHADYPVNFSEKRRLRFAFDAFNVANSKASLYKNQNIDTGFQQGADPTFLTPTQFQRPFYARGSVRFDF